MSSRVLVVEDETHLADGLKFNLEAEGYLVQVVGDGESAIDRLIKTKEKFDAVVLDVMLPGIDGFGVASALRKAKNYVPVLMLTIICPNHFSYPYFWRVFRDFSAARDG